MAELNHLKRARELVRSGYTASRLAAIGINPRIVALVRALERRGAAQELLEIGRRRGGSRVPLELGMNG